MSVTQYQHITVGYITHILPTQYCPGYQSHIVDTIPYSTSLTHYQYNTELYINHTIPTQYRRVHHSHTTNTILYSTSVTQSRRVQQSHNTSTILYSTSGTQSQHKPVYSTSLTNTTTPSILSVTQYKKRLRPVTHPRNLVCALFTYIVWVYAVMGWLRLVGSVKS